MNKLFQSNVEGKVEHFDVYGEVQTSYSQVYWTRNNPINLPPELVKRFKGKVMAITGYEVDQVTHSGSKVSICMLFSLQEDSDITFTEINQI